MYKAVFLDRDGTITKDATEYYTYKLEDYGITLGVIEALQNLSKGHKLIVITNQGGIAKGEVKLEEYYAFSNYMEKDLAKYGIKFDGIYFCPHRPPISDCECRKPKPGMILQAAKEHDIDLKNSWMIGDKLTDILAG
ncbi:MAG: HAD family hydrolase, partial [Nanoarchaeota archaeon]